MMLREILNRERPPRPAPKPRPKPTNVPPLKVTQLPVFRVYYKDLEQFVSKVFGFEFDYLLSMGMKEEGIGCEFDLDGVVPATDSIKRQVDQIRLGRRSKNVTLLLNLCVEDGYMPAGKYSIDTRPTVDPVEYYRTILSETGDPEHEKCIAFKRYVHRLRPDVLPIIQTLDLYVTEQKAT
jgi:hypothetical protein